MAERKYYVYDHISPSGKHYIGITCQRLVTRWGNGGKNYLKKLKNGNYRHPAFAAAIEKYGWDAFEHSILFHNCSEELAKKLEVAYIAYWTERGLSYNCTDGGDTGMRPKKTLEEKKARKKAYQSTEEYKAKRREYNQLYRKEHREELNAKQREKLATDEEFKAKHHARNQKWRQEHKEEIAINGAIYREKNKEKIKAYHTTYYAAHKEEHRAYYAEYNATHKEEIKTRNAKYYASHKKKGDSSLQLIENQIQVAYGNISSK